MKNTRPRVALKLETIRTLRPANLTQVAAGVVATSKQPWCSDTYSASCPK
ncbi:MAG TPA: hypothetical protein VNM90_16165 [Haliangium sp.]|nr:hypothetical protein [Haliangium sp.]